jgi:carbamoyltransferase
MKKQLSKMKSILKNSRTVSNQIPEHLLTETGEQISVLSYNYNVDLEYLIEEMEDILNERVKHREWFRPFAPIVLKEKSFEWFDLEVESPYMLFTCPVKQPWRIPSVTHIDGTARVQTLDKDTNPKLYSLIQNFESITGVPIILNTSLNVNGQPIVETPSDALMLYENSDIDAIVINNKMFIK